MHDINWGLLRLALMTHRKGSASKAADALGVTHATIIRGIKRLEEETGTKLFHKSPSGYSPTDHGLSLIDMAAQIEEKIYDWRLSVENTRPQVSGRLRLATTEIIANGVLCPRLPDFYAKYPNIQLDISSSYEFCNLTRYEADIAIRSTTSPPEHLVGRKICDITWGIYQASAVQTDDEYWVACDTSFPHAKWFASLYPNARVRYQASSVQNQMEATKQGFGKSMLPCFLADNESGLSKIEALREEFHTELWLLYNKDSRNNPRVRAFVEWVKLHFNQTSI
ncbi:MAG: LysR family transcriptional regulator [Oleiphilaceae bacterium]|nr:LysR family transcriptional regulator [Oleiphilaceae bacterium]